MNKIIYTAIFSDYEDLKEPSIISEGWKYICFSDQDLQSDVWEIIKVEPHLPAQRMARYVKIMFHKFIDAEFSFWLDASFKINIDLNLFWSKTFKAPFSCPKHPARDCVYQEINSCLANKRGEADLLVKQSIKYKAAGVPVFNGIITSGVLMRQRTKEVVDICEAWWKELEENSSRDQVSFARVSLRFRFHTFIWDYSQSRELKYHKHYHLRH